MVFQKFYYYQKNFVSEFLVLEIYTYDNFIIRFIRTVSMGYFICYVNIFSRLFL